MRQVNGESIGRSTEDEPTWCTRIGQIETVLRYFGTLCSVSVDRVRTVEGMRRLDTVYVQARRVEGGLEVEMTGDTFLAAELGVVEAEIMVMAGWTPPAPPASPNFSRFVSDDDDLALVAGTIAKCFDASYGVSCDDQWVVSPPEFGLAGAGLAAFEVVDPELAATEVLLQASGVDLALAVSSDEVSWDDLVAAGLPRGDRMAELAMLYRPDCPVAFLRDSQFKSAVLADPALPTATAAALLAADPNPWELKSLAERDDLSSEALAAAALRGARVAQWRGRTGRSFLRQSVIPAPELGRLARRQEHDVEGMLEHPECPEEVVLAHILARSAAVRFRALRATRKRDLAIDSGLIRLARRLPMVEDGSPLKYAARARTLADEILAAR